MSLSVNVSELKSRLSHYLRLVRSGEVVLVRDRNQVIARIDAAGSAGSGGDDERLARLEAGGMLRRRRRAIDLEALPKRLRVRADVVGAILAERDDGR